MDRFHPITIIFTLLSLASMACSDMIPHEVDGRIKIAVIQYDSTRDSHSLRESDFVTLKKLRTLEGDALKIVGKAQLKDSGEELAEGGPDQRSELEKLLYIKQPRSVDFSGFQTADVFYPEDFHSLNMATIYYNFEQAHLFFKGHDVELGQLTLLYHPTIRRLDHSTLSDDAWYDSLLGVFVILENEEEEGLPLGMNKGIAVREYAKAVFDAKVFGSDDVPWLTAAWLRDHSNPMVNRSLNISRSFAEGFADFFAATVTRNPDFLGSSLPELSDSRRLNPAEPRCLDDELRSSLHTAGANAHSPHLLGSIISSALWEAAQGSTPRMEAIALGILASMDDLAEKYQSQETEFSIDLHVQSLSDTLDSSVRAEVCGALLDRLNLTEQDIPSCVGSKAPQRRCVQ